MVIWLIGLSGAGKTTIAREVVRQWRAVDRATVLVDGDEIRAIFADDRRPGAYSLDGRRRNSERISALCGWLDAQGINVVCSILSIFEDHRRANRAAWSRYFEVYVRASMATLRARDSKGLYRAAEAGEMRDVVGVDLAFPEPRTPDLVVDNDAPADAAGIATLVLRRAGALP